MKDLNHGNPWHLLNLHYLVLVLVFNLLLSMQVSSEEVTYKFDRMWPTLPQPWYFSTYDMDIDSNGYIYIADKDIN